MARKVLNCGNNAHPSIRSGELIEPSQLPAKSQKYRIISIDPSWASMTQPFAIRQAHIRITSRFMTSIDTGNHSAHR
jgi:hypothetical protein